MEAGHEQAANPEEVFERVRRAQAGDRAAFAWLHRAHVARVLRYLQVLLGPSADAEDAAQQVFVEAYKGLSRFDFSGQFSTWLHGIALRVALNALRARKRRSRAMAGVAMERANEETSSGRLDAAMAAREGVAELHRHLEELEPATRLAFLLYFVEECELGEVAQRLGLSPGATWARIKRARERVAVAMGASQLVASLGEK